MIPMLGEWLSLLTAIVWATAVIFFRKSGFSMPPLALNLFKNIVTILLLVLTMIVMRAPLVEARSGLDYAILLISGAIGIGVADTLYFKSLNLLGASALAIVDCMYAPLVILVAYLMLDERLTFGAAIGAGMILVALGLTSGSQETPISRRNFAIGVLAAALSLLCMAIGIVMVKPILNDAPLIWAVAVRLVGGIAVISLITVFFPARRGVWRCLSIESIRRMGGNAIPAAVLGGYLSLLCWVGGVKYTQVNLAAVLNQLSTIFILILAAIFLKERLTFRKVAAVLLGMTGAAVVMMS